MKPLNPPDYTLPRLLFRRRVLIVISLHFMQKPSTPPERRRASKLQTSAGLIWKMWTVSWKFPLMQDPEGTTGQTSLLKGDRLDICFREIITFE